MSKKHKFDRSPKREAKAPQEPDELILTIKVLEKIEEDGLEHEIALNQVLGRNATINQHRRKLVDSLSAYA